MKHLPRRRRRQHAVRTAVRTVAVLLAGSLSACASGPGTADATNEAQGPPPEVRGEPTATLVDARPAALVGGYAVRWGDLRAALTESAGAEVLRDAILDRGLERLAADRGVVVGEADEAAERRRLLQALDPDDANRATRLLEELRRRRGLGEVRFEALVRRTALMRALVRGRVAVTELDLEDLHDARHGPRRQVRLITTATLDDAAAVRTRLEAGTPFADLAVELSTDASAARGGLLAPFSRRDPSYPVELRQAAFELAAPGDVSRPVRIENGFALLRLERRLDADGTTLESVRAELEATARLAKERALMDELAAAILRDTSVTIFDRTLEEAWRRGLRGDG